MIHSSAKKMSSRSTSRIISNITSSSPSMRVLQVIQRRHQTTVITNHTTRTNRNNTNRLVLQHQQQPPRCSTVFSPRWFPTPTASLSSSVSTSSASLASVSHLRSTNSSSSSQPPPTYNWQTNLLLLGGAGSLLKSAYGTNNKNNEEQQSITRCDNTEAEPTTTKDFKDNDDDDDDDDDDETHCTICLINRQGPCRTVWRTFERCMKDHSKQQQDDDDDASPVSGMGEKCDGHMMPWITCIQSHRNTYTLISNKFFGDEFVDVVEKGIAEQDKVCLGDSGGDGSSSSSIDWKQFVEFQTDGWLDDETEEAKSEEPVVVATGEDGDADATLVEGVARINLWDSDGTRRIDLAYVRDQDGLLLGHERFTTSKAAMDDETSRGGGEGGGDDTGETTKEGTTTTGDDNKIEEENGNTNNDRTNNKKSDSIRSKITVGHCSFHVSPGSTKAIQIFALYGSKDKSDEFDSNEDDVDQKNIPMEEVKETDSGTVVKDDTNSRSRGTQTLYYSGLIPLDDLKPPSRIKEQSGSATTNEKGLKE